MKRQENYIYTESTHLRTEFSRKSFCKECHWGWSSGEDHRIGTDPNAGHSKHSHSGHRGMVQGEPKLSWSSDLNSAQLKAKCGVTVPSWLFHPWGCQGVTSLHSNKQKKSRNESSWQTGCTKPRWVCSTQSLIIAKGDRASSGVLLQVSGLSKIGQRVSCEAPPRWQCQRNPESRQLVTQPDAESAGNRVFLLSTAGIKTMTKCDLGRKGFNLAYSSVSQSSEGSQGRKWSRCCGWILFTGCFLVACSLVLI